MLNSVRCRAIAVIAMVAGVTLGAFMTRPQMTFAVNTAYADQHRGHLSRLDRNAAAGRVVFLGSSTFQGLDVSSITMVGLNLGLGGDLLESLISRASTYKSIENSRAVVLNIGLNDLLSNCALPTTPPGRLLSIGPTSIPLILVGIQGVSEANRPANCKIQLPKLIESFNGQLAYACQQRANCFYLENPVSSTAINNGDTTLQEVDGIHLNPMGYGRLVLLLRNKLREVGLEGVLAKP